ncbi:MAG: aldo/keto reductase [Acidaminococcus sp.]|jgi:diketogulonate reductase-like aldo/keto reductase|nr:aldo/keto reductase [Acidaminococcus sp.]MCI2099967.1 aldo/keto reductase [Acidaminococcus sp.]MCI2114243.1 aldo/keto reductase [Acidaminococcus sp.]MCI2116243.1 aldo/keto reductase [Acidaminococcus sp.]
MEYFVMNNGIKMPMAGIGVFLFSPAEAEASVKTALKDGVRLIDTANAYLNEKAVGRAIKASGVKRSDIFLVSKLWPTVYDSDTAVDDTLRRLDTDYVDLMFLHQPTKNWKAGYRQLEKAYKEGKIKAIGLSNFPDDMLQEALDEMEIKPQMVQVEAHPYFPETELKKKLAPYGIGMMAWYPLGHGDTALLSEPVFAELGKKYGKTPAQIILRWHIQMGDVVFPGSKNPEHIRANFDLFDFKLTEADMKAIASVNKNKRYYYATPEIVQKYADMDLDFDGQE